MRTAIRSRFRLATLAVTLVLSKPTGGLAQAQTEKSETPLVDTIAAYEKLIQSQPDPPQLKRALYLLGQAYQSSGSFQEAALQYETLAKKFPREVEALDAKDRREHIDSPWALQQAALLRRGLGEMDKWREDVDLFIKNYGGRKEYFEQAAGLFFDLGQHYEERGDDAKLKQHYTEYLKNWADKGGVDRRIIAEVKLGELAWRSSCPVPGVSGACIEAKRERPVPLPVLRVRLFFESPGHFPNRCRAPLRLGPCGPQTKALNTVHARNPALVHQAMAHFQTALRLHGNAATIYSQPGGRPTPKDRLDNLTYHVARARMAQGDVLYEELMRMQPPPGLTFDPKKRQMTDAAQQRFLAWVKLKRRKLDEAKAKYQQVMVVKNSYFTIAAAARISQLYVAFANGMYRAAIPAAPPPPPEFRGDKCDRKEWIERSRDAFCDQMTDAAEPLDLLAKEHLLRCLSKSTELGEVSEWSKLCEEELYYLHPTEYPLPSEILIESNRASGILDIAPLQPTGTEK